MGGKKIRAKKKNGVGIIDSLHDVEKEKNYTTWKAWLKDNLDMDVI